MGFFSKIAHAVSSVASPVVHVIESNPVTNAVMNNPVTRTAIAPFNVAYHIANGDNVFKSLGNEFKNQVKGAISDAQYAAAISSFVPGLGTGVSAGLSAGAAIAQGKPITDALIAATRGAIPGGQLAQMGFDTVVAAAKGKNLGEAALGGIINNLPPGAREGANVALALVHGQNIQTALLSGAGQLAISTMTSVIGNPLWDKAKNAVSLPNIPNAVSAGVKIANNLGQGLLKDPVVNAVATKMVPQAVTGFNVANGLLTNNKGLSEAAIHLVRSQLPVEAQKGFDTASAIMKGRITGVKVPPELKNPEAIAAFYAAKGIRGAPPALVKVVSDFVTKTAEGKKGFSIGVQAAGVEHRREIAAMTLAQLQLLMKKAHAGDRNVLTVLNSLKARHQRRDPKATQAIRMLATAEAANRAMAHPRNIKIGGTWSVAFWSFLSAPWDWFEKKTRPKGTATT